MIINLNIGYKNDIQTYQQAGFGLAGAIDGVIDYINPKAIRYKKRL